MGRLSIRYMLLFTLLACASLAYGTYEFAINGTQLTANQIMIRQIWMGTASISLLSMSGLRLAKREWSRLITGLDASNLPSTDQLQDLVQNHNSNSDALWIADMTYGFLHSGFCHNAREQATNVLGLGSSVTSAVLLGIACLNPITGPLALAGIATGAIGVATLLEDLFSFSRFEFWEETGKQIEVRWTKYLDNHFVKTARLRIPERKPERTKN
jgi:hypothetical protein